MIALIKWVIAEPGILSGFTILLIIGAIILTILIIVVVIYFRSEINYKNEYRHDDRTDLDLNGRITVENKNNYKANPLMTRIKQLEESNKNLDAENQALRDEINRLKSILDDYYDRFEALHNLQTSNDISQSNENQYNIIRQNVPDMNEEEVNKTSRIIVSFSFEEKNGTVKKDDSGDMYLEKSGEYYELLFGKEIFGTAIHLEQLQYNCKIINPKEANNKPMVVVKKPQYLFDQPDGKGILYQKGEVKYQ
jgi:hypothetical protein